MFRLYVNFSLSKLKCALRDSIDRFGHFLTHEELRTFLKRLFFNVGVLY